MFTGIIEEKGMISRIERTARKARLTIRAESILSDVHLGDSIAVNGICLTVIRYEETTFTVDVMEETWRRTALGNLQPGKTVNLERAMAANGRFGGHLVSGHIDGVGVIREIRQEGNGVWYRISAEKNILDIIVEKGSIAIDGISLTVAKVSPQDFSVSVILHTLAQTTLQERKTGESVNLENDMIGKYLWKFCQTEQQRGISGEFLARHGFL